jgi:hypothetical protein
MPSSASVPVTWPPLEPSTSQPRVTNCGALSIPRRVAPSGVVSRRSVQPSGRRGRDAGGTARRGRADLHRRGGELDGPVDLVVPQPLAAVGDERLAEVAPREHRDAVVQLATEVVDAGVEEVFHSDDHGVEKLG